MSESKEVGLVLAACLPYHSGRFKNSIPREQVGKAGFLEESVNQK